MKKPFLFLWIFLLNYLSAFSQNEFSEFNRDANRTGKTAMLVLGSWGIANAAVGGIGMIHSSGESYYFNQMSLIWGAINISIAASGYIGMKKGPPEFSLTETIRRHYASEKIYMINAALDLVYMAAGAYCIQRGNAEPTHYDLYNGYGKSLLLQGGGLFVFDCVNTLINLRKGKQLYKILEALRFNGKTAAIFWHF